VPVGPLPGSLVVSRLRRLVLGASVEESVVPDPMLLPPADWPFLPELLSLIPVPAEPVFPLGEDPVVPPEREEPTELLPDELPLLPEPLLPLVPTCAAPLPLWP